MFRRRNRTEARAASPAEARAQCLELVIEGSRMLEHGRIGKAGRMFGEAAKLAKGQSYEIDIHERIARRYEDRIGKMEGAARMAAQNWVRAAVLSGDVDDMIARYVNAARLYRKDGVILPSGASMSRIASVMYRTAADLELDIAKKKKLLELSEEAMRAHQERQKQIGSSAELLRRFRRG
ncbi:MAG: hypothetical protein KGH69_04075 [Candidatus Micrarchaeota archaeon]|nr:hypothetical protein [Candidatus Micrarchaeota archaeon]